MSATVRARRTAFEQAPSTETGGPAREATRIPERCRLSPRAALVSGPPFDGIPLLWSTHLTHNITLIVIFGKNILDPRQSSRKKRRKSGVNRPGLFREQGALTPGRRKTEISQVSVVRNHVCPVFGLRARVLSARTGQGRAPGAARGRRLLHQACRLRLQCVRGEPAKPWKSQSGLAAASPRVGQQDPAKRIVKTPIAPRILLSSYAFDAKPK